MTEIVCNDKNFKEEECLRQLRELMQGDKHLQHLLADDEYLYRFLICTDFNISSSFKKMKDHFDLIVDYPEWFTTKAPMDKMDVIERDLRIVPGTHDKEGRIVYIVKVAKMDTSVLDVHEDIVPIDDFWAEYYQSDPNSPLRTKGVCVIVDIADFQIKFMKYVTPHNIKTVLKRIQAMPIKEYIFHVVNDSFLVNAAVKIIWNFLPQSIKNSVNFHFTNWDGLYQYIDREALPVEYGGFKKEPYTEYHRKIFEKNKEIAQNFKIRREYYLDNVKRNKCKK